MLEFLGIYKLLVCLVSIHLISGNHTVPTPKKPLVFAFGLPPFSVNVSLETIPIEGIVQYDLRYNETACPNFVCQNECSSVTTDLSLVYGCHRVENQTNALITKTLSCVICNSTENCKSMGILEDNDLCFYFKVTTPIGARHSCTEVRYFDKLVFTPPKSIQVFATKRNQLTVNWQRPHGIKVVTGVISYLLMLQDHHLSKCKEYPMHGQGENNSYTITSLSPWTNYSVTICCGIYPPKPLANYSTCTCGGPKYIPGGPVFQNTLPEEPSMKPLLDPCEASCDDKYFSAILKWKASDQQIWNGIPTKSVITIWNTSAAADDFKLGAPIITLSVPLPADYNGSLVTYEIHNLSSHQSYHAKVQLCSHGGCGPNKTVILSCEKCELWRDPGTPSGKHVQSNNSESQLTTIVISISACVISVILIVVGITWVIKRKKRERTRPSLGERIGDMTPGIYEQPNVEGFTSDNNPYSQVDISDRQSLLPENQTTESV